MQRSKKESGRIRKPSEGHKHFGMKSSIGRGLAAVAGAMLLICAVKTHAIEDHARMQKQVGQFSLPFIANQGQAAKEVAFYAPSLGGGTVVVTTEGKLVYALPAGEEKPLHTGVSLNALREERQPLRQGVTLSEELVGGHIATKHVDISFAV